MSEHDYEPDVKEPPKSDHDLLIEIRDLLKLLVEATMNYPARR